MIKPKKTKEKPVPMAEGEASAIERPSTPARKTAMRLPESARRTTSGGPAMRTKRGGFGGGSSPQTDAERRSGKDRKVH